MSNEEKQNEQELNEQGATEPNRLTTKVSLGSIEAGDGGKGKTVLPLPGIVAIGLYMLVLAATITFGVVGGHISRLMLILAPLFIAASFGILRMFRWAWALTLAAVCLLMTYNLWIFAIQKQSPGAIQGVLNLVFFMYLVRSDVRSRLR